MNLRKYNVGLLIWTLEKYFSYIWFKRFKKINKLGKNIYFGRRIIIDNPGNVEIGDYSTIQNDIWFHGEGDKNKIIIGKRCSLGMRCVISSSVSIEIGDDVIFAPNVFIADHIHAYENILLPIKYQGITKKKSVVIGSGTWLGINVCILPGVTIGKNCVIGSNSVVNLSVPDFSVVVGSPARIIKKYDPKMKKWVKYVRPNK